VKVTLVFWIAPIHVELEFLYITFSLNLLYRNTFELADVVLRPYCRRLFEDCDDFTFGDARVQDEFSISTSDSIVLDNPGCAAMNFDNRSSLGTEAVVLVSLHT